jgi:O-antigen/teichoic acid export membrane protein
MSVLLPKPLYANFDQWIESNRILRLFGLIAAAFLLIYAAVMAGAFVDRAYIGVFQVYTGDFPMVLALLMAGFLWLIPYYFYGNVLIFYRKTWIFSAVTFVAVLVAIPLFWLLIAKLGLLGAGIATVLTQMMHMLGMAAAATVHEPRVKRQVPGHFVVFAGATVCLLVAAGAAQAVWQ